MVLTLNKSKRPFKIVFQDVVYDMSAGQAVEIPEAAAQLYFAYNIEPLSQQLVDWCCERFKVCNPQYINLSNREIWDEILSKVAFGKGALEK